MTDYFKRTWAVVHLDRLNTNLSLLRSQLAQDGRPHPQIMAVVKADGYGHGDKAVARELAAAGVDFFAVSSLSEALSLRRGGIQGDILILGFTPPAQAAKLVEFNITQTVFSPEYAQELEAECASHQIQVRVHIKLDTGMNRLGFDSFAPKQAADLVENVVCLPHLQVQGIFTHLSSADTADDPSSEYTVLQIRRYNDTIQELESRGISISCRHLQNSAGIAFYPLGDVATAPYNYARAGILLYGVAPSLESLPIDIQPVMELKTVVSMVKEIPAGRSVSYGRTFVSDRPMRIATIPIGYADGYPRLLSNRGTMLLHGQRAPIIGNICMDQLMLDVSHIPEVKMGDIVTAIGRDGDEEIGFNEIASLVGTIGYELMCLIGRRVPRVYVRNGETVDVVDYTIES